MDIKYWYTPHTWVKTTVRKKQATFSRWRKPRPEKQELIKKHMTWQALRSSLPCFSALLKYIKHHRMRQEIIRSLLSSLLMNTSKTWLIRSFFSFLNTFPLSAFDSIVPAGYSRLPKQHFYIWHRMQFNIWKAEGHIVTCRKLQGDSTGQDWWPPKLGSALELDYFTEKTAIGNYSRAKGRNPPVTRSFMHHFVLIKDHLYQILSLDVTQLIQNRRQSLAQERNIQGRQSAGGKKPFKIVKYRSLNVLLHK